MLTPILTILGKIAKTKSPQTVLESSAELADFAPAPRHGGSATPDESPNSAQAEDSLPKATSPTPLAPELIDLWREIQIANAMQPRPLNFSQLVVQLKRDAEHPLYPVGIHTLRRHMVVVDPQRVRAHATPRVGNETRETAVANDHVAPAVTVMTAMALAETSPQTATSALPDASSITSDVEPYDATFEPPAEATLEPSETIVILDHSDEPSDTATDASRDFDELHFLSDFLSEYLSNYTRPTPMPPPRFRWPSERDPQGFNGLDEPAYL